MNDATTVLLHPIGNDATSWAFVGMPEALLIELPGHGERDRQPGWTHASFADEIVAETSGPLDVIGLSIGGAIAANILVRHSGRVRSAMIVCSGSVVDANSTPDSVRERAKQFRKRGAAALLNGMSSLVDETLVRWFSADAIGKNSDEVRFAKDMLLRMSPESWADVWNCQANSPLVPIESLREIAAPVTIIGGSLDQVAKMNDLKLLHDLIPRSRFEVANVPHMVHLENPGYLKAAIERHFKWIPKGHRIDVPLQF